MFQLVPDKRIVCLDWDSRHVRIVLAKCGKSEVRIGRVLNEPIPADVLKEEREKLERIVKARERRAKPKAKPRQKRKPKPARG